MPQKIHPTASIERKVEKRLEKIVHHITHIHLHALGAHGSPAEHVLSESVNHMVQMVESALNSVEEFKTNQRR